MYVAVNLSSHLTLVATVVVSVVPLAPTTNLVITHTGADVAEPVGAYPK